jgi:hypothetical protein
MNTRHRENARELVRAINAHGWVALLNRRSDRIELYRFGVERRDSHPIPTALLSRLCSHSASVAAWLEDSAL